MILNILCMSLTRPWSWNQSLQHHTARWTSSREEKEEGWWGGNDRQAGQEAARQLCQGKRFGARANEKTRTPETSSEIEDRGRGEWELKAFSQKCCLPVCRWLCDWGRWLACRRECWEKRWATTFHGLPHLIEWYLYLLSVQTLGST